MLYKALPVLCLCCLSYLNGLIANNSQPNLKNAIIKSAELPSLSQHLAKVYVSLCNNIREPKFYQERDAVIEAFDDHMHLLGQFVPNESIKNKIQKVRSVWQDYKTIANWTINKEGASKLLKLSAQILEATNLLHLAYLDYAAQNRNIEPHKTKRRINEALKDNRNLSILMYRIMLYYLSEKQGIDPTTSGHKLDEAQTLFNTLLQKLSTAKISSEKNTSQTQANSTKLGIDSQTFSFCRQRPRLYCQYAH
jgi:hypothetical protein